MDADLITCFLLNIDIYIESILFMFHITDNFLKNDKMLFPSYFKRTSFWN